MYHEFYVADQKRHIACSHFPQPFLSKDPRLPQANCHLFRQSMRVDTTYVFLTEESFVDNVHTSRAPIHQLHLQLQHDDYDPKVLGRWRWLAKWSSDPSNSRQVKPFLNTAITLSIYGWNTSILELKHFKSAALSPGPQSLAFGMFFPMLLLLRPLQFSWLPMPSLPFSLFRWKNQQQCPPLALIFLFVAILHCAHTIFQTVPHFNIDFQSYMQQVGNKSQL